MKRIQLTAITILMLKAVSCKTPEEKSTATGQISFLNFTFTGYTENELNNIMIYEYDRKKVKDSFAVEAIPALSLETTKYWGNIHRNMPLNNSYEVRIDNQTAFKLDSLTIKKAITDPMLHSEESCFLESYHINGEYFINNTVILEKENDLRS